MNSFYDPSRPLLAPSDIVAAFTGKKPGDVILPRRAIITFDTSDIRRLVQETNAEPIHALSSMRPLWQVPGRKTLLARSYFGGPNIAALVEELSDYGVEEFVIWGYCGAISQQLKIGDILAVRGALREDGVSYHYLDDIDEFVYTDWFEDFAGFMKEERFREALVWSCDAIYRETENKMVKYAARGIVAVEMEVASFYAVCQAKGLKGIAFLIVSDTLSNGRWIGGFHQGNFKESASRFRRFAEERLVL